MKVDSFNLPETNYGTLRLLNRKIQEVCPSFPAIDTSVFIDFEDVDANLGGVHWGRGVKHVLNMVELHNSTFPGQYSTDEYLESFLKFRMQYLEDLKTDMISCISNSALEPIRLELHNKTNKFFKVNSKLFGETNISKRINMRTKFGLLKNLDQEIYEDLTAICNGSITNDNIEDLNVRINCVYTFFTNGENTVVMNVLRHLEDVDFVLNDGYTCVRTMMKDIDPTTLGTLRSRMNELRTFLNTSIWNSLCTSPEVEKKRIIECFDSLNVSEVHTSRYGVSGMDFAVGVEGKESGGMIEPPSESTNNMLELLSSDVMFNNSMQGYTVQQLLMYFSLNIGLARTTGETRFTTFLIDELDTFEKLYK